MTTLLLTTSGFEQAFVFTVCIVLFYVCKQLFKSIKNTLNSKDKEEEL